MILHSTPQRTGIRWRMLIDAIFDLDKMDYGRIHQECGMERYVLDDIIGGRAPNKTEKQQLMLVASKYVAISELLRCGFDNQQLDYMCFLSEERGLVKRRVVDDPIRVFS